MNDDNDQIIRINKFLSNIGFTSRRNAEKLIKDKKIKVNGKIAFLGQKINSKDVITFNDEIIKINNKKIYYVINKPKKTICTLKDNFNRKRVIDLINDKNYLFTIGRLDYDTTGVLLITNDGEMANKLTHPKYQIKRIYKAKINDELSKDDLMMLNSENVFINNKKSIQKVEQTNRNTYLITICQGTYHHIKKLFELFDKKVVELKRVEFAGITCDELKIGEYRKLKPIEIKKIKSLFL